ncbi:hypothetical protein U91I_02352 [alpha proteobacterium U9-1i]|nr:hypothetical protein U91I_02352 [alpha proteobacterium U9-1i]
MALAINLCMFTLDRVRTILLALSLIVMLKTAWVLSAHAILGY